MYSNYAAAISNLGTRIIPARYKIVCLSRFFNGANKYAIYAVDFSNTAGAMINTFGASEINVSYNSNSGWTIKNNIDGAISVIAL